MMKYNFSVGTSYLVFPTFTITMTEGWKKHVWVCIWEGVGGEVGS